MELFGAIGALDPGGFPTGKSAPVYPLFDRLRREDTILRFVVRHLVKQVTKPGETFFLSAWINAIVYVFQGDPSRCLSYLPEVVAIFEDLVPTSSPRISRDELYHHFRTLVLAVDVNILPHADAIFQLIMPDITPTPNALALELLNALIFSVKSAFKPHGATNADCELKVELRALRGAFDVVRSAGYF
jgi:hypothetical protein